MDLQTWANVAEIVGGAVVVGGIAFAAFEVQQVRRQRREIATIELARSFERPEFARALRLVSEQPPGLSAAELRARQPGIDDAATLVCYTFESIAVMCRRDIVDSDLVWELMGGVIGTAWTNIRDLVYVVREEQRNPKWAEWFEWLAGEMARRSYP